MKIVLKLMQSQTVSSYTRKRKWKDEMWSKRYPGERWWVEVLMTTHFSCKGLRRFHTIDKEKYDIKMSNSEEWNAFSINIHTSRF